MFVESRGSKRRRSPDDHQKERHPFEAMNSDPQYRKRARYPEHPLSSKSTRSTSRRELCRDPHARQMQRHSPPRPSHPPSSRSCLSRHQRFPSPSHRRGDRISGSDTYGDGRKPRSRQVTRSPPRRRSRERPASRSSRDLDSSRSARGRDLHRSAGRQRSRERRPSIERESKHRKGRTRSHKERDERNGHFKSTESVEKPGNKSRKSRSETKTEASTSKTDDKKDGEEETFDILNDFDLSDPEDEETFDVINDFDDLSDFESNDVKDVEMTAHSSICDEAQDPAQDPAAKGTSTRERLASSLSSILRLGAPEKSVSSPASQESFSESVINATTGSSSCSKKSAAVSHEMGQESFVNSDIKHEESNRFAKVEDEDDLADYGDESLSDAEDVTVEAPETELVVALKLLVEGFEA